jgi:hypothetical protein
LADVSSYFEGQGMTPIDRLLASIETEPWSALYRGVAGFALPAIFRALCADCNSIWSASALFLGFLVALRGIPLLLRLTLPFSAEVKAIWASQRNLSKQFDSHAWQKLFWIGLGLLLYAAVVGELRSGELAVMLFCLISGGAGLWRWLRVRTMPSGVGATGAAA